MRFVPLLLLGLAHASLSVQAADFDDLTKYRKNVMSANAGLMGASNALLQHKVEAKGQLAAYAKALESLNKDLPSLFPKGSGGADSDALPDVWSRRAEFEQRARDTQATAAAFAKSAAAGEAKAADRFRDLSESCKACHKDFRK